MDNFVCCFTVTFRYKIHLKCLSITFTHFCVLWVKLSSWRWRPWHKMNSLGNCVEKFSVSLYLRILMERERQNIPTHGASQKCETFFNLTLSAINIFFLNQRNNKNSWKILLKPSWEQENILFFTFSMQMLPWNEVHRLRLRTILLATNWKKEN